MALYSILHVVVDTPEHDVHEPVLADPSLWSFVEPKELLCGSGCLLAQFWLYLGRTSSRSPRILCPSMLKGTIGEILFTKYFSVAWQFKQEGTGPLCFCDPMSFRNGF